MRYLGLDIGNRRIGIAVGSTEARIATPLRVLERKNIEHDAARILDLVREYDVDAIIAGLPRNADNTPSEQEQLTRAYVAQLTPLLGLPISLYDERFSTFAALLQQRARGIREKRGRAKLDADAAAVILQSFLDSLEP
ncbi:MAG TPA: Holliday junction resolvase RuvX [Anaerolineae bacterium]|nr:Holliday junction resolvase RuvX [Anaerolineae bacterium]